MSSLCACSLCTAWQYCVSILYGVYRDKIGVVQSSLPELCACNRVVGIPHIGDETGSRARTGWQPRWGRSTNSTARQRSGSSTKKAFDSVPHRSPLDKLKLLNLHPVLIRWICSYPMGRAQRVVIDGESSEPIHVLSGVPQGSVLGPLLFLIYIDDVTTCNLTVGSKLSLYADDMLLYKPITVDGDYVDLQSDIDSLNNWVSSNHLDFNTSKCKFMLITRKKKPSHPPPLRLQSSGLEQVESIKYLGLLFSSDLSWAQHIDAICAKAKKMIGLCYRRFYKHTGSKCLLQLYLALIRPHTEYASQVWSPYLQKDIDCLEGVQKFALRMCSKQWKVGYHNLRASFGVPSLSDRRLYLNLCMMYKIIHNFIYFPVGVFVPRVTTVSRSSANQLYVQPFARTNAYYYSFVPSTCSVWNSLPSSVTQCSTLTSFKSSLGNFLL